MTRKSLINALDNHIADIEHLIDRHASRRKEQMLTEEQYLKAAKALCIEAYNKGIKHVGLYGYEKPVVVKTEDVLIYIDEKITECADMRGAQNED